MTFGPDAKLRRPRPSLEISKRCDAANISGLAIAVGVGDRRVVVPSAAENGGRDLQVSGFYCPFCLPLRREARALVGGRKLQNLSAGARILNIHGSVSFDSILPDGSGRVF